MHHTVPFHCIVRSCARRDPGGLRSGAGQSVARWIVGKLRRAAVRRGIRGGFRLLTAPIAAIIAVMITATPIAADDPRAAAPEAAQPPATGWLQWRRLPDLPSVAAKQPPLGLAGAFVGVHHETLVVAGGANFPYGPPWSRGPDGTPPPKVYHSDIYLLGNVAARLRDDVSDTHTAAVPDKGVHEASLGGRGRQTTARVWRISPNGLPFPFGLAYGVSVTIPQGVLCIGGEWQETAADGSTRRRRRSDRVFLITTDARAGRAIVHDRLPAVSATGRVSPQTPGGVGRLAGERGIQLPKLPVATSMCGGTLCGDTVYVVGGMTDGGPTDAVWALDLSRDSLARGRLEWTRLPDVPHDRSEIVGRVLPVVTAQHDGRQPCVYVFSGRAPNDDGPDHLLYDAWRFDPIAYRRATVRRLGNLGGSPTGAAPRAAPSRPSRTGRHGRDARPAAWKPIAATGATDKSGPQCRMGAVAAPIGANHVILIGGDDGQIYRQVQTLQRQIERLPADDPQRARLEASIRKMLERHPGFRRDVLLYNCVTDRWFHAGTYPGAPPVTTSAAATAGHIVIPSGESRPGVRTPQVWAVRAAPRQPHHFGWLNWAVVVVYLAALVGLGSWFAQRESSTEDFFLARGRIPWWAAGLSIFATMLSAITYLAIPARAYGSDWVRSVVNFGIPVVAPVVAYLYLPVYRRRRLTSVYEYLEERFHVGIRLFGSLSFVAFQLGRMAIVVLLPALALSAVTGIAPTWCILITGVLATLYTVLGGIEAVIWTDVIQAIVLLGGAAVSVVLIALRIDGGCATIIEDALAYEKLRVVEWHWDFSGDAFAVVVLGALFTNLLPYSSDQSVVQRYLTTASERSARQALWTNAGLSVLATVLFFGLGTFLFSFYHRFPERLPPLAEQDQVFAWFIGSELPAGVAGLVIAGVFAATMSSLDSSMHSVATALSTDFVQRFGKPRTDRQRLRIARFITCLIGLGGTTGALVLAHAEIRYLFDFFLDTMGLLLGTLGGVFALGVFTRRVGTPHVWPAIVAGIAGLAAVRSLTRMNGLAFGAIAICVTFGTGVLLSYLLPRDTKAPLDLTAFARYRTVPDSVSATPDACSSD
ncbi:MAG: hypothetical protein D6725_12910 [Planctomycetota bacterium]|nr:MAG: hypothetical protein D6725_12910 [Planctomycetota bacterium]